LLTGYKPVWYYPFTFNWNNILSLFIPARLLQLNNTSKFYERFGVKFIRRFVQNGDYVTRHIKKSYPRYKLIKDRTQALKYIKTIMMYERYHFLCFVFFLLTAIAAIAGHHYFHFALIILCNIIYNVCPIMLQQYNRTRVLSLIR
jgi:hypothetical protein